MSGTDVSVGMLCSSNSFSTGPVRQAFQPGTPAVHHQILQQQVPQQGWMVLASHYGVG